jgi:hypothetical protein
MPKLGLGLGVTRTIPTESVPATATALSYSNNLLNYNNQLLTFTP